MNEKRVEFVKWFSELDKNSENIAGGKGANLSEMYNMKIPVPPGFVVTAQAYDYFIKHAKLDEKIAELLARIDYENTKKLDEITKQIRTFILESKFPKEMEEEIIEAYGHLSSNETAKEEINPVDLLKTLHDSAFVAVRSSATAEDSAEASFAGQGESFVNVKGNDNLLKNIRKCFSSLFTSRSVYYRHKKGFSHDKMSLAVVVQKMVDSDKSGVIFSKDPSYKNDNIIIEAVWGLGEGIVSGRITPDKYIVSPEIEIIDKKIANKKVAITRESGGNQIIIKLSGEKANQEVLTNYEIKMLAEIALKLENHYKKPQDIEFAVENKEIYIVQTRPITTIKSRIETKKELSGDIILAGLAASPGIASGKIKIINDLKDLDKINTGDILVTKMTNPDMVVTMQKSAAIITDEGGLTAHASIVSREMGIPCVVGTQEATTKLKEGEIITVDGYTGKIYKGKIAGTVQKNVLPVTAETRTKIKVMVDLPSFAERASKSGIKKVGLTRIEGIIAESGKHPEYFLKQDKIKDYEEIIFKGIKGIANLFDELWIRTSDIRSDEFQNLDGAPENKEANPMLGLHGIRYGLKNPEILKAELKALKKISETGKKIGVLLPQVISVDEVQKVKKFLKEINFSNAKVGVMIETPAAVQIIKELCEEKIDFISFGTNDLTQYMLAVDRGNQKVQDIYNEMHPAVLYQLEYVIRVCKRNSVETSICGQAGSKKEMVKFLVEKGIDSISVNADSAKEISEYVAEIEKNLVKWTDKEPRQYNPKKETEFIEREKPEYLEQKQDDEFPEIRGAEKLNQPTYIVKDEGKINEEIEAVEEEKQEYLEENPEEQKEYEEEGTLESEKNSPDNKLSLRAGERFRVLPQQTAGSRVGREIFKEQSLDEKTDEEPEFTEDDFDDEDIPEFKDEEI